MVKISARAILLVSFLGMLVWFLILAPPAQADFLAQQPTVDIPTVTGSPSGPMATVNSDQDEIRVRSGPSTDYPQVGVLVAGQRVPALGRTFGGDWIQIAYPGVPGGVAWVYTYLVTVDGSLPVVEVPSTPTPKVTPTINPTLAAQFIIPVEPTRPPTFTASAPLIIPTYPASSSGRSGTVVPMGFVIIGLAVVGFFGLMISLLRGR
jgi:uncharacterized protein YraI